MRTAQQTRREYKKIEKLKTRNYFAPICKIKKTALSYPANRYFKKRCKPFLKEEETLLEKNYESRKTLAGYTIGEAGKYLLAKFNDCHNVVFKEKGGLDLVSETDEKSEKMIVSEIKRIFPKDGILTEESPEIKGETKYRWIIDPLDGTHNFLAGLKEFGVLLALEEKNEIVLGILYFPARHEFFSAEKGRGAFCNGNKIKVSDAINLKGQMFCSDGIMRRKKFEILRDIERFCDAGCRLRVYGSSAFSMTKVAIGSAIVATNRLVRPWDIAAPALLVEEAGGIVLDEKGGAWRIDSESVAATTKNLRDQVLNLFGSDCGCGGSCPVCRIGEVDGHRCSICGTGFCLKCHGM